MNIQIMLLPHKHIRFSHSLLAIAGYLRQLLTEPYTVDEIWALIERKQPQCLIKPTFTQLVLAIDVLFAIQQAISDQDGRIFLVNGHDTNNPVIIDNNEV